MSKRVQKSWRDLYPPHPAAEVFPMMSDEELRALGEDIKKNGLTTNVVLWHDNSPVHSKGPFDPKGPHYVLDGRNRLEAMQRAGLPIPTLEEELGRLDSPWNPQTGLGRVYLVESSTDWWSTDPLKPYKAEPRVDPVAYVISANIRRRHLTKSQQADLIVKAVESTTKKTSAKVAKVSKGKRGPAKDPIKAKVIEEAAKNDISARTAERALAEHRGPKRSYVTCPDCSQRVEDLGKHMAEKHKGRLRVVEEEPLRRSKKQALGSLKQMAIDVDSVVAGFRMGAVGDLDKLVSYDEAQKDLDMLTSASKRLDGQVRLLAQKRAQRLGKESR